MDIKRLMSALLTVLFGIALVGGAFLMKIKSYNDEALTYSSDDAVSVSSENTEDAAVSDVIQAMDDDELEDIDTIERQELVITPDDEDPENQGVIKPLGKATADKTVLSNVHPESDTDLEGDDAKIIYLGIASRDRIEARNNGTLFDMEIDEGVSHTIGLIGSYGIDVSKYNKDINWQAVKDSGVEYAIIRCGYRGANTGYLVVDPYWEKNIAGAKAAGLKVGAYFFTQAISEAEAIEEAKLACVLSEGYSLDYPVFIDIEGYPGRTEALSNDDRTGIVRAFVNEVKTQGMKAGVYANKNWFTYRFDVDALPADTVKWLAQYNVSEPSYEGNFHIWQYSSKGMVPGIIGNVDVNQSFISLGED